MTAPRAAHAVALLRENDATDDRLRETFRDIKAALRVPLVAEVFQAWAAVPRFLEVSWRRLRPNVISHPFLESTRALSDVTERAVAAWPVADHVDELRGRSVSEADIARMRQICELFFILDHKLLIVAHAVRMALEGEDIGGGAVHGVASQEDDRRGGDFRGVPMQLVDSRDAPFRVRAIFESIKSTLELPYLPSDYRAIAAYPDWLEVWWRECKIHIEQPRNATLRDELVAGAVERARQAPYRIRLSAEILANYRIADPERRRLLAATREICAMMPQQCVNVAIARRGVRSPSV